MALYVLGDDGRTPILTRDVPAWGEWFQNADRTVRSTRVVWGADWQDGPASEAAAKLGAPHLHVSTVFLGIDQGLVPDADGRPVLWETMILAHGLSYDDEYQKRYSSYEKAVTGHERAVKVGLRLIKRVSPVVASRG